MELEAAQCEIKRLKELNNLHILAEENLKLDVAQNKRQIAEITLLN